MELENFQMVGLTAVLAGVGLSASAGFRVFVPLLFLSLAGRSGMLPLAEDFQWVTSTPALIMLATATVLEIGAYYVPWVDNTLDLLATPAAMVAGVAITAAVMPETHPALQWSLALIAGGGAAGIVQTGTVMVRGASTLTSGGLSNPAVSTAEAGSATVLSVAALLFPFLAIGVLILTVLLVAIWLIRRRRAAAGQPTPPV